MIHLFEDLIHFLGPDKRFWVLVVDPDELLDGFDQIRHAFKDTPPDAFACDLPEPAFHQIEPGRTGGSKMQMKARVFLQPLVDIFVVVSAIVVQHQMQVQFRRGFAVNLSEES